METLSECVAKSREIGHGKRWNQAVIASFCVNGIQSGQLAENPQQPCSQNTNQNRTLDALDIQNSSQEDSNDCQQCTDARGAEVVGKGNERNQRGIIVDDNTSILQPDKGNINLLKDHPLYTN